MFNFSYVQEVQLLLCLTSHANAKGEVNFYDHALGEGFVRAHPNGNAIESKLYELDFDGVINFEMVGDDGFKPIVILSIKPETHKRIYKLVLKIEAERSDLALRLSEILTFNPEVIAKSINESTRKIEEAQIAINSNDLLKPLSEPLSEIYRNFQGVESVFRNYEEVYKNIIRPVQEEGRSGVRTTVRWALIGIVVSVCLPLLISYWGELSSFVFAKN